MLDKRFQTPEAQGSFELDMRIDTDWATSKRRVLLVIQTVDGADLAAGELGSTPALIASIKYAREIARRYNSDLPNFSFAVTNFNARRHLNLKGQARAAAEDEFKARQLKLIKKLNPTHIFFSGDINLLYPVSHAAMKNGWVHDIDGRKVVSSVDFGRLMDKQGLYANLLGFWCRHLANLLLGYLPHDLSGVKTQPVFVGTMTRFNKLMALWDAAKRCAVDTETRNLSVTANAIYTIQFAFDSAPTKGYVLPIDHPHETNPFSPEDRKVIKRELRKRFGAFEGPELVTFNGMFDLRIIRQALKLPIIFLNVWEITAGEHDLDENISSLASIGIKAGGLAAVYASYGNDFYFSDDTKFSKAERSTTGSIPPNDPDFLLYGASDVVSILHIADQQVARAGYQMLGNKPYTAFFVRHVRHQMSDTAHVLSQLKQEGSLVDVKYLRSLMRPDSQLAKAIEELGDEFKAFPEVIEANKQLMSDAGMKTKSLFGGASGSQWVFSFNKSAHKIKLFIDVCKLKSVSKTQGGQDAIDKEFIEHYKDRNYLVAKFGEYQIASKLLSTYIKGWYKQLTKEIDGATDGHLRSDYVFFDVDTGRLASRIPNLQNIPSRGKLSKIIKEMFITEDGHLQIRFDYSAHEVRGWSILAGDTVLAAAFKAGQALRKLFIKTPTDELRKEIKTKGDIHIANVKRFFGKWVEKTDPLRDAVKAVVFGVLYGKSAATLGNDTKRTDLDVVKAKIAEAYKAGDKKLLAKHEAEFIRILEEDRSEGAQEIIDKMFSEFKAGDKWVKRMQRLAAEKFYVFSSIGRIRHLYAILTGIKSIVNRQIRRGMNAPGQGFASEIAVKAARRMMVSYYKERKQLCDMLGIAKPKDIKFNRIVHDALYFSVPYDMVIPFLHILQYEATYGVALAYEREFGLTFTVEPEIEIEIGTKDTNAQKWDWSLPELRRIIETSVDEGIKNKLLTATREDILKQIWAPWKNDRCLSFLDKEYPLLNVSLKKEIRDVVKTT